MRALVPIGLFLWCAAGGCIGGSSEVGGTYTLDPDVAGEYPTAYVAEIVADPPGDDLRYGAGEHLIIRNNAKIRIDVGGWWIDVDGQRLPLGIGRQIEVGAELAVHPASGETRDDAIFLGREQEVLAADGGEIVLRDSAGAEVARFEYGSAG